MSYGDSLTDMINDLSNVKNHAKKFENPIIDAVYKCIPVMGLPHHFDMAYSQEDSKVVFVPVSLPPNLYKALDVLSDLFKSHPKMQKENLSIDKLAQTFCEYLVLKGVMNCIKAKDLDEIRGIAGGLMTLIKADAETYEKIKEDFVENFFEKGDEDDD